MRKGKGMNGMHIHIQLYDRTSFFFLRLPCVYNVCLSSFFSSFLFPSSSGHISNDKTLDHKKYCIVYIDVKNAHDVACRIIFKRYKPFRAHQVLSISLCIREKRQEREKKNRIIYEEKKRER